MLVSYFITKSNLTCFDVSEAEYYCMKAVRMLENLCFLISVTIVDG